MADSPAACFGRLRLQAASPPPLPPPSSFAAIPPPVKVVFAFITVAAVWGASFLFLRIAVPEFGPILSAELRVTIAWVVLTLVSITPLFRASFSSGDPTRPSAPSWQMACIGILNSALPFALYGWAALSLPAGYLAILNALAPLWGGILGSLFLGQPFRLTLLAAVCLAGAGISMLVHLGPVPVTTQTILAAVASAGATLSYAVAAHMTDRWLSGTSAFRAARNTMGYAGLSLIPFMLIDLPTASPTLKGWMAILALALISSALAYLLYFWLLKQLGPIRASSVTFLIPGFGVIWGAIFLGEPFTLNVLAGLVLVVLASLLVHRR